MAAVVIEKIERHMFGKYRGATNFYDRKREYLCRLYDCFRGEKTVSFAEAESAARAWSQSQLLVSSVARYAKTSVSGKLPHLSLRGCRH